MNKIPILITSAGMPRSGSTWLYNAIRLMISNQSSMKDNFGCGWIGDWEKIQKKEYMLIKTHAFDNRLTRTPAAIFYSYRDIRDAIASNARKFGSVPSLKQAGEFIELHEKWIRVADFSMKYESMLNDKERVIISISNVLSAKQTIPYDCEEGILNAKSIAEEIADVNFYSSGSRNNRYNETNLFHKGHITDGRHGAWKEYLDAELVSNITDKYQWWFNKYDYQI